MNSRKKMALEKMANKAFRSQLERETVLIELNAEQRQSVPYTHTPALYELLLAGVALWCDTKRWERGIPQSINYRGKRYALKPTWLGRLIVECSNKPQAVRVSSAIGCLFDPMKGMALRMSAGKRKGAKR